MDTIFYIKDLRKVDGSKLVAISYLILFSAFPVAAQQVLGLWISNYGGLYRAMHNPSVLGSSRYKWQVNLATTGSTINNRYFIFFGKSSFLYPLKVPHSTDELYGQSRTMGSITQSDPLYVASEVRWPSAMVSIGKDHGLALQVRSRGRVQGHNIPEAIRTLYYRRLDSPNTPVAAGEWGSFDLSQQSFSEASLSYGVQLLDFKSHKLKVGATLKRVFGARVGYLKASADRYEIRPLAGGMEDEKELRLTNLIYEAGYSYPNENLSVGDLFDASKYGAGWGYDLGVTYELGSYWDRLKEDDDARPGYLIRLSASITDVGAIQYKSTDGRVVSGQQSATVLRQSALETLGDRGADGFISLFPTQTSAALTQDAQLPTAVHLGADVQLIKSFFVNVAQTRYQQPASYSPINLTQPDLFMITPRFENEDSGFSLPLTFIKGNNRVSVGAMARFGPLHVGFSNITGLLNRKDPDANRATFMYVGFSVWRFKDRG